MCTNKSVPAKQTKTLDPFQSWNQLLKNVPLCLSHTPGSTLEQSSTVIKRKSSKGRNSFNVSIQRSFGHVQHNHMGCKGKHATAQWYKKQFCKQIDFYCGCESPCKDKTYETCIIQKNFVSSLADILLIVAAFSSQGVRKTNNELGSI